MTTNQSTGHYHDPLGLYDFCADPKCPRSAEAIEIPVLDLSDNGGIFCGYVDGTVPTMVDCARAGCYLCQGELDIECDDSWMES